MKKFAVLASIVLLMVFAISCGGRNASTSQAPKVVDWNQHETFTVWLYSDLYDEYSDYSENPVVWALNKKFNVTLKFEQPVQGTESDAMALMFGTGEYTDMIEMSLYTGSIAQLYEEGVIIDIADYLDYMPNFKRLLETNDVFRRMNYTDDGHIFSLGGISDVDAYLWSGIVYRHDILETMTGGNVRFPSGNSYPKTIEDWEYMLPLFKAYFESWAADYAPLIIPANGSFYYGDFANSFGAQSSYYVENNRVYYGFYEDPFYTYLMKMREWYAKGWIYKDFASRVNDRFYLPNPALTYGGSAGAWLGLQGQVGDSMSMPQYGMFFDVRAAPSPLSTADGITEFANFERSPIPIAGSVFTTACKNLPKLLSIMDYLFSNEGGMLKAGLTRETGSAENRVYQNLGVPEGFYWYEGDTLVINPKTNDFTQSNRNSLTGFRLPGMGFPRMDTAEHIASLSATDEIWDPYPNAKQQQLPMGVLSYGSGEEATLSNNQVAIDDYIGSMVPRFIMGTIPLDPQAWTNFKAQIRSLGMEENLRIQQAAYDRYLKR